MNLPCLLFKIFCTASIGGAAYVIDGDTISIDYQHIRLAGIDAEEMDEPHGVAARDHLIALVAGRRVTCQLNGERSHDRLVGTCGDLNERMVKDGYALDCARYSGGRYRQLEPIGARLRLMQKGYCR